MLCSIIVILAAIIVLRALINNLPHLIQTLKAITSEAVDLKERYGDWAVITGASDGIGKAYAEELARRKINIALIGRNRDKLQAVATDLEGRHGIQTKIIIADFAQGRPIYEQLKKDLEPITIGILVNNVGIQYAYPMPIAELPEDEIWDNVNVNITSATMMTRIVLPQMLARNKGAVVTISSSASERPMPYMNLYAASKSYGLLFSEALREEVKGMGITVQTLTPMYISSKINHFVNVLRKVSLLIPDVETYAYYAVNTLGKIDSTTGYWPHSIQATIIGLIPQWILVRLLAKRYKAFGKHYLRKLAAREASLLTNVQDKIK